MNNRHQVGEHSVEKGVIHPTLIIMEFALEYGGVIFSLEWVTILVVHCCLSFSTVERVVMVLCSIFSDILLPVGCF